MLGAFPDEWWGSDDIASKIGRFHLDPRDVVLTGDKKAALDFYERTMVIGDQRDHTAHRRRGGLPDH